MKAFRVHAEGFDRDGIYWAENASKARYRAMLGASDAGYDLAFRDLRVRRAPEYDSPKYTPKKSGIAETFIHLQAKRREQS